jgi:hypothetical protein
MNPSTLSVADWCELIGVLGAILGGLGYIGRLYLRSGFATKAELREHRRDLDSLGKRTDALEALSAGLATSADVNKVLLAIERADGDRRALAADLAGVKALLTRIEKPLDLMQEHLLRGTVA